VAPIVDIVRAGLEAALWPLDRVPPGLAVVIVGAATGLFLIAVMKWCSPQRWVARARDRMSACIYEMRLFLDSPRQVVIAQGRLLAWTAVYLLALAPALLAASPGLGLLYLHLEARHGLAPVEVDRPLVVRIGLADGTDGARVAVTVDGPAELTAPLLHARHEPAVYARLRIAAPGSPTLLVTLDDQRWSKRIDARATTAVAAERAAGLAAWLALGDEPALSGAVASIRIPHPAQGDWSVLPGPWWLWWLGVATAVALALRGRLGVTF
jgi:hypothetical protein